MSFNLKVRRFKKPQDLASVSSWLMDRNLDDAFKLTLPRLGWIVLQEDGHPIAAGFIRKMENCQIGMVDSFITNPHMPPRVRDAALNLLLTRLIFEANRLGYEQLIGLTVEQHILIRVCKYGFQTLPSILVGRRLKKGNKQ